MPVLHDRPHRSSGCYPILPAGVAHVGTIFDPTGPGFEHLGVAAYVDMLQAGVNWYVPSA